MHQLIELERGIYSTTINDEPAVVAFVKRTRKSADDLGQSVTVNTERIKQARKLAGDKATAYVAVEVWHKAEYVAGFAMPIEKWSKYHVGQSDFPVGPKAVEQFKTDEAIIRTFRVHVRAAEKAAPAPEPKPEPKAAPKPEPKPAVVDIPHWTEEEEKEIAKYQETEGITRKSAIQKMRRLQQRKAKAANVQG
ncbi:MAG TPA: hypothetical protein VGT24_06355 [Candidatus Acidoferrales bacterium]|nr:hypothetical protein [Candidatus Acidoferrales bacterium]